MIKSIVELIESSKLDIDPAELEYPKVADPPEGWASLRNVDGNTWYQKALNYETWQDQRLLPLKYSYDTHGNVILNDTEAREEGGE